MNFDPLGIFLVSTWTCGEKLLFRYPCEVEEIEAKQNAGQYKYEIGGKLTTDSSSNGYALNSSLVPRYSAWEEDELTNIKKGVVVGFEDSLLANLLISAKTNLCKRKYDIKVGDIVFAGFSHQLSRKCKEFAKHGQITFSIVFALHSQINSAYVPHFQELSEKICLGLIHEEDRTGYMSQQKQAMLDMHESVQQNTPTDKSIERAFLNEVHRKISNECSLGIFLKDVYNSLCETGHVDLFLNKWVRVSCVIDPKIPRQLICNPFYSHKKRHPIFSRPSMLQDYLNEMRPYHSFLLLEEKRTIENRLTLDCNPVLKKLFKTYSFVKSMEQMSCESDVALTQIRQAVCSLVTWGFAMIIFPIYDSNIYVVSPNANLSINSSYSHMFSTNFPGLVYSGVLARFSNPIMFRDHREALRNTRDHNQDTQVLSWLLKRQLVYQLHTYLYVNQSTSKPIAKNEVSGEVDLFDRLAEVYFNGQYHLEAIMFKEGLGRTQLCHIIDQFRDRLHIFKHEEPYISYWVTPDL